jgi:predicted nucleic acid-binding protein
MNTAPANFRVVLDTNQVISAGSRWLVDGRPVPDSNTQRRVLIRVAESHTGLYSGKVIGEYLEKLLDLGHPPNRAWLMITYIMGSFSQVEITSQSSPHPPTDPDDEVFLICAIDGNADYLVTEDRHLTALTAHYTRPIIGRSSELAVPLGA